MKDVTLHQQILEELLTSLGLSATTNYDEETNMLEIDTEDHAILIGKKGENLRSLQYIYNLLRSKKSPDSEFIALDVAGYKKDRGEKVKRIAEENAAEVIAYGGQKNLPAMNSFERRIAHMALAQNSDIVTESIGEEPNRSIVIKRRDPEQ